jgi:hypothetical protein
MDDANNPLLGLLDAVGAITAVPGVDKYAQRALDAIKYQREMGVKVWYVCAYMCVLAGVWRCMYVACGVWSMDLCFGTRHFTKTKTDWHAPIICIHTYTQDKNGLTDDEAASLNLYSQETPFYSELNATLRDSDRDRVLLRTTL